MRQAQHGPMPAGIERQEFLERQPTYWLKRCYQTLRRDVDAALRPYGLTLSQRDVLLTLFEDGPQDQGALRERLGLEQSSVSRLMDGLVKRGLVVLAPSRSDRRFRIARLTEQGKALLLRTPGSSELAGEAMITGFGPEERQQLVDLLRRCTDNLERVAESDAGDDQRREVSTLERALQPKKERNDGR